MLRPDLAPIDVYLADAMTHDAPEFLRRHPWPVLIISEPDWEKIKQLGRPETLIPGQPLPAFYERLDLTSATASAASLDALILPLRPLAGGTLDRMSIGRSPDRDVVLLDETVSKHHADVSWDAERGRAVLTDCGSKNGIHVDGVRLESRGFVELIPGRSSPSGRWGRGTTARALFWGGWPAGRAGRAGRPERSNLERVSWPGLRPGRGA